MRHVNRACFAGLIVAVFLAAGVAGQTEKPRGKFSIGAGAGIFQPLGGWADHRYAPGINQFTTGFALEFIVEYQLASWMGLAVTGGGGSLGTGEWVNYAQSLGDDITASAMMYDFSLLIRPYVLQRPAHVVKLDVGIGCFSPRGSETFQYFSYDYSFLKNGFAFVFGAEYCWFFKPKLALACHVGLTYTDCGVKYADDFSKAVMGMPLTIGIRFHP